jgi:hypothetical protein
MQQLARVDKRHERGATKGGNKRRRRDESRRHRQVGGIGETHLVGAFFQHKGEEGRVGENANGMEYLCHLEAKSCGAGCDILIGYYISDSRKLAKITTVVFLQSLYQWIYGPTFLGAGDPPPRSACR